MMSIFQQKNADVWGGLKIRINADKKEGVKMGKNLRASFMDGPSCQKCVIQYQKGVNRCENVLSSADNVLCKCVISFPSFEKLFSDYKLSSAQLYLNIIYS